MAAPRRYPEELRERAIRLTLDARKDPAARAGACSRIGEQLGINAETLRGWVTQAEIDAGGRPGTSTSDADKIAQLERDNRELRRANGIFRSASASAPTSHLIEPRSVTSPNNQPPDPLRLGATS
jgi:transposase